MKTITYVFFIYVSITAFDGISAEQTKQNKLKPLQNPNKSQCDLQSIIEKSNYVVPCLDITTNGSLPEMDWKTRNQYLCTRIFGTVDKICNLHLTSINSKSFVAEIEKLRSSLGKNVTKFCSQLNETLVPNCNIFCNDVTTKPVTVDSMCIVVHWKYNILATSKIQIEHEKKNLTSSEGLQPAAGTTANKAKTNASNVQDGKDEAKKINSTSNSTVKHEEIIKTVDLSKDPSVQKDNEEKDDSKEEAGKRADNTGADIPPGHENTDMNAEKSPVKKPAGSLVGQKVAGVDTKPATLSAGKKQSKESEVEENSPKLNEGEEDVEDPVPPPMDAETTVSHQLAQTVPASNPDTEDKHRSSGKDEVVSEQESVAPQEHIPVHAGPPDPPQHFFAYFMAVSFICILCYIGYHKKHKIMGIIFEGRKSRGGRGRRRPNTAGYRKLDCNLEEAVTSQCNSNVTHVIY